MVAGEQALHFEWRAKQAARECAWEYEGLAESGAQGPNESSAQRLLLRAAGLGYLLPKWRERSRQSAKSPDGYLARSYVARILSGAVHKETTLKIECV